MKFGAGRWSSVKPDRPGQRLGDRTSVGVVGMPPKQVEPPEVSGS